MWKPLQPIYNLYRRWFGTYSLDDPRPTQKEAPYTFFLPDERELAMLRPGDLVKLIFRSHPRSLKWEAERMWVEITAISENGLTGRLNNEAYDMPQMPLGTELNFQRYHVVSTDLIGHPEDEVPEQRQYWDRCFVDKCVLDDAVLVHFIYREEPDTAQPDDKYPDSGWRIRGDYRGVGDEEFEAREISYVALGAVLNADDTWLHLIDAPMGSAFMRNFETGEYEPYDRSKDDDDN